jgi:hypothetical protein
MILLLEQRDGVARPVLPAGRDVAGRHQALAAEITAHLTPIHAALFSTPVSRDGGIAWYAPGAAMRRFEDLDAADRDRLTTSVKAILSDIRRLAEAGTAPAVAAAWPALLSVPDLTHVFAIDGRPVLAGWGFAAPGGGPGPLYALDDGVVWRPAARVAWGVYAIALAALAALALIAGLVLAPLTGLIMPSPTACHVTPEQLALLGDQSQAAAWADTLKGQLAQLREARGEQALQCPIPRQVAVPPPPPTPPPHADLPQDRWDKHDLGMLEGCWNNYTQMPLESIETRRVIPVKTWVFCFDGHGHGRQTITLEDGQQCRNDLTASFTDDGSLLMRDGGRCQFPHIRLVRGQLTCQRETDVEAACLRRDLEGPTAGKDDEPGRFRRAARPAPNAGTSEPGAK